MRPDQFSTQMAMNREEDSVPRSSGYLTDGVSSSLEGLHQTIDMLFERFSSILIDESKTEARPLTTTGPNADSIMARSLTSAIVGIDSAKDRLKLLAQRIDPMVM